MVKISSELYRGLYLSPKKIFFVRGGIKKTVFFYFLSNRGGGLGEYKKSLSENTKIFTQSKRVFWHNLPKKGGFYKKNGIFLTKGGGVSANPKNPYQKILGLF